jgi:CRP-like cAMP-binding protein
MKVRVNAEMLRRIPLFEGCDPAQLQILAFASERMEFPAGATMVTAGEADTGALLILAGTAEVWIDSAKGPQVLAQAAPGTLLGELAMIGGIPPSFTATASTPVTAARIRHPIFMRVVEEYPEFGAAVLAALAEKLDSSVADFSSVRKLFEGSSRSSAR